MDNIQRVFYQAGIDVAKRENVYDGHYDFDGAKVFVQATLTIDCYRLYFQHEEYSFEVKKPAKVNLAETLYMCMQLVPSVLFGCCNLEHIPAKRAVPVAEPQQLPQNYYNYQPFRPELQQVTQPYANLPQIGRDDLTGGIGHFAPTGNQMGREHPFFGVYPRVRRDDIYPDTSKPDGLKSDLDKKYMFL